MAMRRLILFFLATVLSLGVLQADSITLGAPATGRNGFPFGMVAGGSAGARYQQVYSSGQFAGPMTITEINFFLHTAGNLADAVFTLSFSTTSALVDALNTVNFDANLGVNNALVTSVDLGGAAAPAVLSFGGAPFAYDPSAGNLLLDIQLTDIVLRGTAFYQARNGDAGGIFSRAHNFGVGFEGYGLVTQFVFTPAGAPSAPEFSGTLYGMPNFGWLAGLAGGLLGFAVIRRKSIA